MNEGYEKRYYNIIKDHKVLGMTAFHSDPSSKTEPRVMLRHFSMMEQEYQSELLPDIIAVILDNIWKQVYCTSVKLELHFVADSNGKWKANDEIRKALLEAGFKLA